MANFQEIKFSILTGLHYFIYLIGLCVSKGDVPKDNLYFLEFYLECF